MNYYFTIQTRIVFCFLLVISSISVGAQSSVELKKQQAAINKEIAEIRSILKKNESKKKNTLASLNLLRRKLKLREKRIRNINADLKVNNQKIINRKKLIENGKQELKELQQQYAKSVRNTYVNKSNVSWLAYILNANSLSSSIRALHYFRDYQKAQKKQADVIKKKKMELEGKIDKLRMQKERQQQTLSYKKKEKSKIVKERSEKNQLVSTLKRKTRSLESQIRSKQKNQQALKQQIQRAIQRELEAERRKREIAKKEGGGKKSTAAAKEGNILAEIEKNFMEGKGTLTWPIKGIVLSSFGEDIFQNHAVSGKNIGTSFRGKTGEKVVSIADGLVSSSILLQGIYTVIIKHGSHFSGYGNLASISVKRGQRVQAGQQIGTIAKSEDGDWGEIVLQIANLKGNVNPEEWIK